MSSSVRSLAGELAKGYPSLRKGPSSVARRKEKWSSDLSRYCEGILFLSQAHEAGEAVPQRLLQRIGERAEKIAKNTPTGWVFQSNERRLIERAQQAVEEMKKPFSGKKPQEKESPIAPLKIRSLGGLLGLCLFAGGMTAVAADRPEAAFNNSQADSAEETCAISPAFNLTDSLSVENQGRQLQAYRKDPVFESAQNYSLVDHFINALYYEDEPKVAFLITKTTTLRNADKVRLIKAMYVTKPSLVKQALEEWKPVISLSHFKWFLKAGLDAPLVGPLLDCFQPGFASASTHARLMKDMYSMFGEPVALKYISRFCRPILNDPSFVEMLPNGWSSEGYRQLIELGLDRACLTRRNIQGKTPLEGLVWQGDVTGVKKLGQEAAQNNPNLQECFRGSDFSLADIDPEGMIAQNGCRTIVLRKDGKVLALPGQEAKALFNQVTGAKQEKPAFTVFLNDGHASIAFANGLHIGFYPRGGSRLKVDPLSQAMVYGLRAGQSMVANRYLEDGGKDAYVAMQLTAYQLAREATSPCELRYDSPHRPHSEENLGLKLDFYATEEQVQAMTQYMDEAIKECAANNTKYDLLSRNCIDFVQEVIASTGTAADFRDSFSRKQLWERGGEATLYSMWNSNGPEVRDSAGSPPRTWSERAVEWISPTVISGISVAGRVLQAMVVRKIDQYVPSMVANVYSRVWLMGARLVAPRIDNLLPHGL